MTTNTDSSRQFDVARVLAMALRVGGVAGAYEIPDATKLGQARDWLDLTLDALATEGVTTKTTRFDTVAVVAGTSTYQLSASVLEVLDPAWYAAAGESEPPVAQSPMDIVGSEEWATLNCAATGVPNKLFVYRGADGAQAWIWPTPSADGTLRLRVQRMLMDAGGGEHTVELERYWTSYLIQQVGGELAQETGLTQRAGLCFARALELRKKAMGQDTAHTNGRITFVHETIWDGT